MKWANIDNLEDYNLTYLLYKESLTVPQIARVRNMSEEDVNSDLIKAKIELRRKNKNNTEKSVMQTYLGLAKDERLHFIGSLNESDSLVFKRNVYKGILNISNIDDLMILVWSAGEMRDPRFLDILYPLTEKNHSNLRRVTYSAIGKIGSEESIYSMELGLLDENPQIRQYCVKYLGDMGTQTTIKILENLVQNKAEFEKEYVIRAAKISLEKLYKKFNIEKRMFNEKL